MRFVGPALGAWCAFGGSASITVDAGSPGARIPFSPDEALTDEVTLPRIDTVLTISGKGEKCGEVVFKMVNTSSEPAAMSVQIMGARVGSKARRSF